MQWPCKAWRLGRFIVGVGLGEVGGELRGSLGHQRIQPFHAMAVQSMAMGRSEGRGGKNIYYTEVSYAYVCMIEQNKTIDKLHYSRFDLDYFRQR